jgi:hypothetical protein
VCFDVSEEPSASIAWKVMHQFETKSAALKIGTELSSEMLQSNYCVTFFLIDANLQSTPSGAISKCGD